MPKNDNNNIKESPSKISATSKSKSFEWEEVKKARNRINSQRIRERERAQIANLEAERARLWLSNDAIRFQNSHFREIIAQIVEVCELKRSRAIASGGMGFSGVGLSSASIAPLATSFGATGTLGGSSMQMPLSMRTSSDIMCSLGGGLDTAGLIQSSRFSANAVKSLSGLSDTDLLARHHATTVEMQNMMRQQETMDRLGAGIGIGMVFNNGININGINVSAVPSTSSYVDMTENLRIRQLMLQKSTTPGVSDLSGSSNSLGASGFGGDSEAVKINASSTGLPSSGGIGDLGSGIVDVQLMQISKRKKIGY